MSPKLTHQQTGPVNAMKLENIFPQNVQTSRPHRRTEKRSENHIFKYFVLKTKNCIYFTENNLTAKKKPAICIYIYIQIFHGIDRSVFIFDQFKSLKTREKARPLCALNLINLCPPFFD